MTTDSFACDWPAPAGVRTLLTTRAGGVSRAPYASFNLGDHVGDEPSAVQANRERLAQRLPAPTRWLRQVHGIEVVDAGDDNRWRTGVPEADAAFSHSRRTVCAVLVADCLPVLLCSREAPVVAVAHAGWRGLSGGVLEATVAAMRAPPRSLLAYLGPAIGPRAFEVGGDVLDAFAAARDPDVQQCFEPCAPAADGTPRWLADLFALARLRLRRLGIEDVHGGIDCTASQPERFFSHRRDRRTGRQAALIWMD